MKGKLLKIDMAGKITVGAGLFALLAIALLSTVGFVSTTADAAKSATTTVKVLNTPPVFFSDPTEVITSSTNTPTTFGNSISFSAQAYDSSNNGMYLLICKTGASSTASSVGAPTCGGGISNQIAVTESPVEGNYPGENNTMLYATSTNIDDTANETQAWYAFLCDNEARNPRCTTAIKQGTPGADNASPYYINHPHNFISLTNDGPKKPGETLTFSAAADESMHKDIVGPADTIKLSICKLNDFNVSTASCGAGGTWATSTAAVPKDATASITFGIPFQDAMYSGYGYIIDNHGAQAVIGGAQGVKFDFAVANAAPKVTESSIAFASSTLVLTNPLAKTEGFGLIFETTDDNSCTSTIGQAEMKTVRVQVGRDELFGTTCKDDSPFDSNSCYTSDADTASWNLICTQDASSCTNKNDVTVTWSCSFPLWSNAQPTDFGTPWTDKNWNARVTVADDNNATGTAKIETAGRFAKVQSFPFIELGADTIDFGEFEPGQAAPSLGTAATGSVLGVKSQGNTAFDLDIQTSDMCTDFSGGKCTGNENTNTIFGDKQHFGTTQVPYSSPLAEVGSSTGMVPFDLSVKKPTATGTPSSKDIYWGIQIPASLTVSGDYKGVNNIQIKSETTLSSW